MPRVSKLQISLLMFMHAFALGAYVVPLPTIMKAQGFGDYVTVPYIISAIASFISPMFVGSLADRKYAPERLLGVITMGAAILMGVVSLVLKNHLGLFPLLLALGCYHFWASPGWGLLTAIGLMNVNDPQREFAPLRVWATIGFMGGAAFVSYVMQADRSYVANLVAVVVFFFESLFCFSLPPTTPPASAAPKRLRDYFGWDAIQLLKDRDHRMIFVTSALFSIPLASFYPYTAKHLDSLGEEHVSGVLSIAQITEIFGMYGLALIMTKFRLKWLIIAGMILGIARYAFYSLDNYSMVVAGIALHGLVFTLFYMTTQIYVEQRVPNHLRNQAQAFLQLMTAGVGNLSGFLLGAWLFNICNRSGTANWHLFWGVLTLAIVASTLFFLFGYRGAGKHAKKSAEETTNPI